MQYEKRLINMQKKRNIKQQAKHPRHKRKAKPINLLDNQSTRKSIIQWKSGLWHINHSVTQPSDQTSWHNSMNDICRSTLKDNVDYDRMIYHVYGFCLQTSQKHLWCRVFQICKYAHLALPVVSVFFFFLQWKHEVNSFQESCDFVWSPKLTMLHFKNSSPNKATLTSTHKPNWCAQCKLLYHFPIQLTFTSFWKCYYANLPQHYNLRVYLLKSFVFLVLEHA